MTSARTSATWSAPGRKGCTRAAAAVTPVKLKLKTTVAKTSHRRLGMVTKCGLRVRERPREGTRGLWPTAPPPSCRAASAKSAGTMSRSASGALLAWTDLGGLSSSQRIDVLRIAMRLAGYEPRVSSLKAAEHDALVEALLPEGLRPTKKDRQLSLERCVSVMLGGMVPEDKVLTLIVNKVDKHGNQTANAWQVRRRSGCAARGGRSARGQSA